MGSRGTAAPAAEPSRRRPDLAASFRRLAEQHAAGGSPLHARTALALAASAEALRALQILPARQRQPALVLAVLHDLALAGRAPALAAAYGDDDAEAAAVAAVATMLELTGAVAATAARRRLRSDGTGPCAVLHPAIARAARLAGADAVGLVALGGVAGLTLQVDRVAVTYGDGPPVGDPRSPVRLSCTVVGDRPVPRRPVPEVVARVLLDPEPLDLTDPEDARWLRACGSPDAREEAARLEAEVALARTAPPQLVGGDVLELLPQALARVPAGALPVVTTSWSLSRLPPARRPELLRRLDEAAGGRTVAWVSVEGVGVAPSVPTLGDRHASGHSLVGVAVHDRTGRGGREVSLVETVARCWSRGRLLAWLADA